MKRIARFCIFSNLSMSPLRYGFQIVSPYSITDWTNNWIPNYGGNPTLMFIIELFNMNKYVLCIPVNPPPLRGSLPRKSLISRMDWVSCAGDINLPHTPFPPARSPPQSSTIKSWPTFCDQYFWKFPIWNSRADEKRREIRMVKVFKWYPVIDLFDTFTGKLGHGD
jgi:hypothetical protein